jgi:hypothetical protein
MAKDRSTASMIKATSLHALVIALGGATAASLGACGPGSSMTGSGGATGSGGRAAGTGGTATGSGGAATGSGGAASGSGGAAAGSGGAVTGTGGATTGTGGGSSTGGGSGTGGAATGSGGAGGGAGTGGRGGATGTGGGGGSTTGACPANATFCSGFEDTALPMGAIYRADAAPGEWTRDFAVDTSVFKNGRSSLRVKLASEAGTSGSAYQMLAVPAPTAKFWVRFHIRSDVELGGMEHNVFATPASSDATGDRGVEFAEDVGIAFNASDVVRWPAGYGRLPSGGTNLYKLAADTWHCVEIAYDGQDRVQILYVNGTELINAPNFPASSPSTPYRFFKFGYHRLHNTARRIWFDDVAVAPQRVGCF